MKEMAQQLNFNLPILVIQKAKTPIIVPQKTLSKLEDRVENVSNTIFINDNRKFANLLLIDDAVGYGATINETVRKIRQKGRYPADISGED